MSKNIRLSKKSTVYVPEISSYLLVVEVVDAQDMPKEIFVNQRIRNFAKNSFDDAFAAVCTPTQLEDFPVNAPDENSSFYRTSKIELVGRTAEMVKTVFDSLVYEVKKLVVDLSDLDNLSVSQTFDISATSVISNDVPVVPDDEFILIGD
ncbi:MAG: hypothetical protein WCL71_03550 [Deltaproteobacteria bacterium]